MSWTQKEFSNEKVESLMEGFGLSRIIAILLSRMDLEGSKVVKRFLSPKLTHLSSPFQIPSIDDAIARLILAIEKKQRVFVLGDYDVDGVTSNALFVNVMRSLGLEPVHSVPNRSDDGVGLSLGIVDREVLSGSEQYDLVVALDCGSNDYESIESLVQHGVDVLIIDHHQIRGHAHDKAIIVNPHLAADDERHSVILCSVALTFKLLQGLLMRLRAMENPLLDTDGISLKDYLDLVALGTVTDLVPLVGENRVLVSYGLQKMGKSKNVGLQALMDVCGLPYGKDLDVTDVSFKIGPRINAGGRMADATMSVNLLTSPQFNSCVKLAHELDSLNQDRQSTERAIYDQAISYLSKRSPRESVVLYDSQWHTGVVGIVASRIARQYEIPVIVLGSDGELARGSARSIESVDMIEVLEKCDALLENWGGHPMAAGLSLRPENVELFRQIFSEAVDATKSKACNSDKQQGSVWVDAEISPQDISYEFIAELKRLGPFGVSNPEPVLLLKNANLASKVSRFGADNFKFWVNLPGREYDLMCLGWSFPSRIPESRYPLDLVISLKWHEWKGRGYPQATIVDWKYSV